MKILRQLWNQKGLDAAVEDVPEDRYGFGNIAENISRSILTLPLDVNAKIIGRFSPFLMSAIGHECCPLSAISSSLIGVAFFASTPALRFSFNR